MKKILFLLMLLVICICTTKAQNDTVYGMNFTTGNLQFASLQISSGNTTLYGSGPITADLFQSGVYDYDPFNKRYFYPRGGSNAPQLITVDATTGSILHSPFLTSNIPSISPFTNIAYDWVNAKLYGTHYAFENNLTKLRFATVDIQTGLVTIINNAPISTTGYVSGNCDIDPINGRFFMVYGSRIKTVDVNTGLVIENKAIQYPLGLSNEFVLNITYNWSDGLIYCLYMYPNSNPNNFSSYLKLASLDPTNGQLNVISQSPISTDGISSGDCDIDVIGNRYFYIRQGTLYLVDLTTGTLINTQAIQNPNEAVASIINMSYDDLSLPQTTPATLNLADTIYKLPGETIQIDAFVNQNADYNWSNGDNSPSIFTNQEGLFSVTVMVDDFEIFGQTYVANQITSSIENQGFNKFKIFPNPNTGMVLISFNDLKSESMNIEIYSPDGKQVYNWFNSFNQGTNQIQLDLTELPSGCYLIKLSDSNFEKMQRLMIE